MYLAKISRRHDKLENLLEDGFFIAEIAKLLNVSERTIHRRISEFGLSKQQFSDVTKEELDEIVEAVSVKFPYCGELLV